MGVLQICFLQFVWPRCHLMAKWTAEGSETDAKITMETLRPLASVLRAARTFSSTILAVVAQSTRKQDCFIEISFQQGHKICYKVNDSGPFTVPQKEKKSLCFARSCSRFLFSHCFPKSSSTIFIFFHFLSLSLTLS